MLRTMFKSKIHRATVTHADLDYEGSVTIDADLLEAADLMAHEQVHIWNITRGTRIETYTLRGEPGSGVICINGAAAHQNRPGDLVIIASFGVYSEAELERYAPKVVLVDNRNRIVDPVYRETAGPERPVAKPAH
jgi:aspartate 1-decarboxylase